MQRQTSILSFLKKPDASAGVKPAAVDVTDGDIKGTDTPPEKVPRRIFADSRPSLFSTIKHKFAKADNPTNSSSNSRCDSDYISTVQSLPLKFDGTQDSSNGYMVPKKPSEQHVLNASRTLCPDGDRGSSFLTSFEDDVLGPETPGTRPLVPRLKRVQEDICNFENKAEFSLQDNRKRTKLQQASNVVKKTHDEDSETISKFEWLRPSQMKDGNGRKPENPLYDRRTLYIPPNALRTMSASQRQYWDVKRQYMDVVLFFKVGKFYELYELDAEIGHKELDWKITQSGVGKCRQVGVSESGIDDAVQKLIARGINHHRSRFGFDV